MMCGAELKNLPEGVQRVAAALQALGHPHAPVMLDLGARYLHHGRARYLPARVLAGGSTIIRPIESEANLVLFQLGVTVGLR